MDTKDQATAPEPQAGGDQVSTGGESAPEGQLAIKHIPAGTPEPRKSQIQLLIDLLLETEHERDTAYVYIESIRQMLGLPSEGPNPIRLEPSLSDEIARLYIEAKKVPGLQQTIQGLLEEIDAWKDRCHDHEATIRLLPE